MASLSAMSLLSLTSHHHLYHSHNTLSMHRSGVISRQTPALQAQHLTCPDHGTRVCVRDLFGNMPVRVKQRASVAEKAGGVSKEWDALKKCIVLILLAWPTSVTVGLRECATNQKLTIRGSSTCSRSPETSCKKVCSILSQACFITTQDSSSWVSVEASTSKLKIAGVVSIDPIATRHVQFIAFGVRPLVTFDGSNILQDEINRWFQNSAFGNEEDAEEPCTAERARRANDGRYKDDGHTGKELKGRKGVDRWPMFYINIEVLGLPELFPDQNVDDILDDKASSLTEVVDLLRLMIVEFLTKHHFRPKATHFQNHRNDIPAKSLEKEVATSTRSTPSATLPNNDSKQRRTSRKHISKVPTPLKPDSLGVNVKLPSFRRSLSLVESPYDAWSRAKCGNPLPKSSTPKLPSAPAPRPSTAPIPMLSPLSNVTTGTSSICSRPPRPIAPLLSSTGKVIRRPFDDVLDGYLQPKTCSSQTKTLEGDQQRDAHDDEIITWVNPITKVESRINRRTGLILQPAQSNIRRTSTPLGSRLSTYWKVDSRPASPASETSPWISSLLETWDNPIFKPTETSIPVISFEGEVEKILHGHHHHCTQLDIDKAFKESSSGISGRISKRDLATAEVISQVDKKFILMKLGAEGMLVIVDQHAADERIRIEGLMEELCTPLPLNEESESRILTAALEKPIIFDLSTKEIHLLRIHRKHFTNWGIVYQLPPEPTAITSLHKLSVKSLPPGIIERCKVDPRALVELLRTEVWKVHDLHSYSTVTNDHQSSASKMSWLSQIHMCPQGILDLLNSRACRSAVMFNDELSPGQSKVLIGRLAECIFPFQCAHGRPSLVPLVELGVVWQGRDLSGNQEVEKGFGKAFGRWKASLEDGE